MEDPFHQIIILTAPSGAGKTSVKRYLMEQFPSLSFSVSATTRAPRPNEQDRVDYHFLSVEEFKNRIRQEAFIEYEMVYEDVYYGTLKTEIDRIWGNKKIPLLDIDVQGAMHVQQLYAGSTLSIFIKPPSMEELANRLKKRGTETDESLAKRIDKAGQEMSFASKFDIQITNDVLEQACLEAKEAVAAFLSKTNH